MRDWALLAAVASASVRGVARGTASRMAVRVPGVLPSCPSPIPLGILSTV